MVRPALTPPELEQVYAIRYQVFVEEQGVPLAEERDEWDARAHHWLLWDRERAVATARLVSLEAGQGKVGRVAVLPEWRGRGAGRHLMDAIHQFADQQGLKQLKLDAQVQVIDFYSRLGYVAEGELFEDCGIVHRRMVRWLD